MDILMAGFLTQLVLSFAIQVQLFIGNWLVHPITSDHLIESEIDV
jgi:hypothetical protein